MSKHTYLRLPAQITRAIVLCAPFLAAPALAETLDARLLKEAFDAANKKDAASLKVKCEEMLDEFKAVAESSQRELLQKKAAQTPEGQVDGPVKEATFARGPLNGVATCLYLVGRQAERDKQFNNAKEAYRAAAKLTYARAWDNGGFFWSPAKAAAARLEGLPSN